MGVTGVTPKSKRNKHAGTTSTRLAEQLCPEAKIIASYRGIMLVEYLTELLRPS